MAKDTNRYCVRLELKRYRLLRGIIEDWWSITRSNLVNDIIIVRAYLHGATVVASMYDAGFYNDLIFLRDILATRERIIVSSLENGDG